MTGPHTKPLIFVTKALKVSNIPTSLLFSFKKDDLPFFASASKSELRAFLFFKNTHTSFHSEHTYMIHKK